MDCMTRDDQNATEATNKQKDSEKGAIIVEATLSLTIFMFAMFTMLSLIQVAYTQSRISVALCTATKEIAQLSHIYFATGLDESFSGTGGESSATVDDIASFIASLGGNVGEFSGELGDIMTNGANALQGDSISDYLKSAAGQAMVLSLMKKNLVTGTSQSAEDFLAKNRVTELSLAESAFLEGGRISSGGSGRDIFMRVVYTIQVIRFFNLDIGSFQLSSWAYTTAWGN